MWQSHLFAGEKRLKQLSKKNNFFADLEALIPLNIFIPVLTQLLPRPPKEVGGRPGYPLEVKFRMLSIQNFSGLSFEETEYLCLDRYSYFRFLNYEYVPDANTLQQFHDQLSHAQIDGQSAIQVIFNVFDTFLRKNGCQTRGGQIIDASIISAPHQRMSQEEKTCVYEEGKIPREWLEKPRKLAQKDCDARWNMKYSNANPSKKKDLKGKSAKQVPISVPYFGYKDCISIDKKYGMIRRWGFMSANRHDSNMFCGLLDPDNTNQNVWGDSAYFSKEHETYLRKRGYRSRLHRKKQKGKPLAKNSARTNHKKSVVRALVEYPFS